MKGALHAVLKLNACKYRGVETIWTDPWLQTAVKQMVEAHNIFQVLSRMYQQPSEMDDPID